MSDTGKSNPKSANESLIFAVVCLVLAFGLLSITMALHWVPVSTTGLTTGTVTATLTAFFAVALIIERAGEVCIQLAQKGKRKEINSRRAAYQHSIDQLTSESETLTRIAAIYPAGVTASGDSYNDRVDSLTETTNHFRGLLQSETEMAADLAGEAQVISAKVALPLSFLIAASGLHFMEGLFGAPMTGTLVMDADKFNLFVDGMVNDISAARTAEAAEAARLAAEEAKKAALQTGTGQPQTPPTPAATTAPAPTPDPIVLDPNAIKDSFSVQMAKDQIHLQYYRFVDIIITSLLLAGGSAGIRTLLEKINGAFP